MSRCTNLKHSSKWTTNFIGECCSQRQQTKTTVPPTSQDPTPMLILQFNCNGISGKCDEIIDFMIRHSIMIAAIQETKLSKKSKLPSNIGEFSVVRKDRTSDAGGGLCFIIHNSIKYQTLDLPPPPIDDLHMEQQGIIVFSGKTQIKLINIYIPPDSCCQCNYHPTLEHLLSLDDAIIMGDFNAHHKLWFSKLDENIRGTKFAEEIALSNYVTLNLNPPARIKNNCESSPDFTLASNSLLCSTEWCTKTSLGSDHLPIIVSLQQHIIV